MANITLASPEFVDDAGVTISAGSVAAFPASNLQNLQPTKVWRSTSTGLSMDIDLGQDRTVAMVALLHTNLSASATWTIQMAATQLALSTGPRSYDEPAHDFWGGVNRDSWRTINGVHFLSAPNTDQWMRIQLSDASNPDGYLQAGRLYISDPWTSTVNMSYGWGFGYKDDSRHTQTLGGQTIVTARGVRRELKFSVDHLSETEMYESAFYLDRTRGSAKDILALPDHENTSRLNDQAVHGISRTLQPIINPDYALYKKRYIVTELT